MSDSELQNRINAIKNDGDLTDSEKASKIERITELFNTEQSVKAENEKRNGKGTRLQVASTRGKGSMIVTYEAFDTDLPDTLPTTIPEFAELTGIADEKDLVALLIEGKNAASLREASDPIAEFVVNSWPDAIKTAFRIAVRQTAKVTGMSFEEVANYIKPGIEKKLAA